AAGHDARCDGPGDARRIQTDSREDDGTGALDAAWRRPGRADLARDARPGGRLGHGARSAGPDRERPPAFAPGRPAAATARVLELFPGLVPDVVRGIVCRRPLRPPP